jgi:hypothetical protein
MNKSTFKRNVKDHSIDIIPPYKQTRINGPSIDELQRRYLSGNCLFRQYFRKWYQLSRLQKFCEVFMFTGCCLIIWFLLGCWGLLCENVFYDRDNYKEHFLIKVVIALITCIIHQTITGSIIFFVGCINLCINDNRRIHVDEKSSNSFNACHCILYFIISLLIILIYVTSTYFEYHFQESHIEGNTPDLFTNESIPYTICGLLKPFPVLFFLGFGIYFDESDQEDHSSKKERNRKSKKTNTTRKEDGYNSV